MQHIAVVGGGVIGVMTALALSRRADCRVTVLERGELGREASWAGGGIVSPLYPWRYAPPVTALARLAQAEYPRLANWLHETTGIDPEYEPCGMLMLDAEDSRDAQVWAAAEQQPLEVEEGAGLYAHFPFLASGYQQGLWMPALANIRNPRLMQALRAALLALPAVTLREHTEVAALWQQGDACRGLLLADGERLAADAVVVCGGAWTASLLAGLGIRLPVRPVQGQMIIYKTAPGSLPCMLMSHGRYLIPRRDGHVLCGSTLDEVGFAKATTQEALTSLRASAEALWPALAGLEPVAHWAGLRPASPNGIPFIGPVPSVPGLWVNAGQFRNGLVLAPASAALLADLLLGRPTAVEAGAYKILV